jgi:DNA-binding GntR family transcriptional regulator
VNSQAALPEGNDVSTDVSSDLAQFFTAAPERGNATDIVTEALREAIVTGFLAPGAWLREDKVAKDLGVSRTPVREAFRRLADEQLVVKTAHQGTMVAGISFEDVTALYAIRIPLEGTVARFAAERRSDHLVTRLRTLNDGMRQASERGDSSAMVHLNHEFHRTLSDSTNSLFLQRMMTQVENFVRRLPSTTYRTASRRKAVLTEHEAIIRAIDAGDPERASNAAIKHMSKTREFRLSMGS